MINKHIALIVIFLSIISCTKRQNQFASTETSENSAKDTLITLDLGKDYPKNKLILQDIADVEYIPLETRNNILVNEASDYGIYDSIIIFSDFKNGEFLIFDKNGKIKNHFKNKGGSGEEYRSCLNFMYDEKAQEIFVLDDIRQHRILVYSIDGRFKRKLSLHRECKLDKIVDINDSIFLAKRSELFMRFDDKGFDYLLMSKKDARLISALPISSPKRLSRVFTGIVDGKRNTYLTFPWNSITKDARRSIIADKSSDTVYLIQKDAKLKPLFVRKPSVLGVNPTILIDVTKLTDRYFFFTKEVYDYEGDNAKGITNSYELAYDRNKHELFEMELENSDFLSKSLGFFWTISTRKNQVATHFNASELYEAFREDKLSGRLKEIAAAIKEDDNPVLMIITFK